MFVNKKILVIVESPAKAKIIAKYLGKSFPKSKFVVEASFGHIRDLVKKELGVRLDKNFECDYTIDPSKQDVVEKLKNAAKGVDLVLLASDNDREGEAIAWHLREVLKLRESNYARIVFNEITEKALAAAVQRPLKIDMDLVRAQQTRRIIDRIVGFKLSPLLWGQFRVNASGGGGLSAGRVQSAVLNIIVEREKEIQEHKSSPFWTVKGAFVIDNNFDVEDAKLNYITDGDGEQRGMVRFESQKETKRFLTSLQNKFTMKSSRLHDTRESPDAPFVTSSLQQEAYNKLGYGVKQTMSMAQKLYEMGFITYMRTDSFALSKDAIDDIAKYISNTFGNEVLQIRDYTKSKKIKNSQEAHEAIRPTNIFKDAESVKEPHLKRLYDLIRRRTIASQMSPAVKAILDVTIIDAGAVRKYKETCFKGSASVIRSPGYLLAYDVKPQSTRQLEALAAKAEQNGALSIVSKSIVAKNGWTSAPARYNEAALIKVLERDGLGRPSTYSSILERLYEKNYVSVQDVVGDPHINHDLHWTPKSNEILEVTNEVPAFAEKSRLVPTEIGKAIHGYLAENFSDLIDKTFTAGMEDQLDNIAEGNTDNIDVMKLFWKTLEPRIVIAESNKKRSKDRELLTTESTKYTIDGHDYSIRIGKYGPFIENIDAVKGDANKYIALKPYLTLVKKNYTEINKDEVELLAKMPYTINGANAMLKYGRFGFYIVTGNGETYTVPLKYIKERGGVQTLLSLTTSDVQKLADLRKEYFDRKGAKAKLAKTTDVKGKAGQKTKKMPAKPKKNKDKYKPKSLTRALKTKQQ